MRLILLGCAVAALTITAPAAIARDMGGGGWHGGGGGGGGHGGSHHGHHQQLEGLNVFASADNLGRRRSDGFVGGGYGYGYGMEDRTFEPDSYNDWWHDNPARAYPRWVQDNKDCAPERMWWHGDTLRC